MDNSIREPMQEAVNIKQVEQADNTRYAVIPRSSCIYRCIDLSDTNAALSRSSLNIQLSRVSPFKEFDSYVIIKKQHAMFWLWDDTARRSGAPRGDLKGIPESLYYGDVHNDKVELLSLEDGYEARYWHEDILQGSQYWSEQPTITQWNQFRRHHSLVSDAELPSVTSATRRASPWHKPSQLENLVETLKTVNFSLLILAVFLVVLSFQLASILSTSSGLSELEQNHDAALAEAGDIVTARDNAMRQMSVIQQIDSLSQWPSQIELLAVSNQLLRDLNATLISWRFDDGELVLVIRTENQDSKAFVANFENTDLFESVRLDTQANQNNFSLQMQLKSRQVGDQI